MAGSQASDASEFRVKHESGLCDWQLRQNGQNSRLRAAYPSGALRIPGSPRSIARPRSANL